MIGMEDPHRESVLPLCVLKSQPLLSVTVVQKWMSGVQEIADLQWGVRSL
jgi:hypothetical protein